MRTDTGYTPYLASSVSNNRIGSRPCVNLNGKVKLFGGINNLFDRDPPPNLRYTGNGRYVDPIGRACKIGVRADW